MQSDAFQFEKNARAYQRLVTKIFHDKIDKSMEVYVDDMIVNRKKGPTMFLISGKHLKSFGIIR